MSSKQKATGDGAPAKRTKTEANDMPGDGQIAGRVVCFDGKFKKIKKKDAMVLAAACGALKVLKKNDLQDIRMSTLVVTGEDARWPVIPPHPIPQNIKQKQMTEEEFLASMGDLTIHRATEMSASEKARQKARAFTFKKVVFVGDKEPEASWIAAVEAVGAEVQAQFSPGETDLFITTGGCAIGEGNRPPNFNAFLKYGVGGAGAAEVWLPHTENGITYEGRAPEEEQVMAWDLEHFNAIMSYYLA